ncbi:MAG: FHA domain-containing protein [Eggerthellaceae bacterium]|nr:FHA domain-containing protein [Eggerthellaceae bacterium]
METPREVMFDLLQKRWHASNKDVARAIVLHESVTSGKAPVDLIETRSNLSRYVVHVEPGEGVYGWLAPYERSVPRVMGLVKKSKLPHGNADILAALTGEGAERMSASLDGFGGDGALYANVAERVSGSEVGGAADAAEVSLALFVVAGCTGDAREAARFALDMAKQRAMMRELRTNLSQDGDAPAAGRERSAGRLALYRLEDGLLSGSPRVLSESAEGTEIGAMSLAAHSINDVGPGVSRRHARIWRDGFGTWRVEGLGSTNGTVLVRADGERVVVEPPRSKRDKGWSPAPAELQPGDRLVLAGSTEFSVVAIAE